MVLATTRYAFTTREGKPLWGSTPREVISSLRKQSWFRGSTFEIYLKKTAARAKLQTGEEFRSAEASKLLYDLINAGLVTRTRIN